MKKNMIAGAISIVLSFILLIVFIVGGVSSIQSGPAAVLEKLEKAINKGDNKAAMACFGMEENYIFSASDIKYFGQEVNLIPGEVEEIEGEKNRVILHYAVVTESKDGVTYSIEKDTFVKKDGKWIIEIF